MKKLIVFTILFIGLRVHYHRHELSLTAGQTAYADDWGEEDNDYDDYYDNYDDENIGDDPYLHPQNDGQGNTYYPINNGVLPPDNGSVTQISGMMCVPTVLSIVSNYLGEHVDDTAIAETYIQQTGVNEITFYNDASLGGVAFNNIEGLASQYFNVDEITSNDDFQESIGSGNAVIGTIENSTNTGGHEVFIVSSDDDGNAEYFDPQTGHYGTSNYYNFLNLLSISKNP